MSIFGKIMSSIFGTHAEAAPAPGGTPGAAPTTSTTTSASPGVAQPSVAAGSPATAGSSTPAGGSVDVGAVLDKAVKDKGQNLNWKTSIVDLMKALDLDSSLTARKELAQELHYTGDANDSATMNVWLHKQVMAKLAANGGKVPADLRD
jgi:hypothetical protein